MNADITKSLSVIFTIDIIILVLGWFHLLISKSKNKNEEARIQIQICTRRFSGFEVRPTTIQHISRVSRGFSLKRGGRWQVGLLF